jgi:hypothetical protein
MPQEGWMGTLVLAFVAVGILAGLFYAVSRLFWGDDLAGKLAAVPLGSIGVIHQWIEKRQIKIDPTLFLPTDIVRFNQFLMPWWLLVIYGSAVQISLTDFTSFIGAYFGGVGGATALSAGTATVTMYYIGHWVGVRSNKFGPIVIACVAIIARTLIVLIDLWFVPAELLLAIFGEEVSINLYLRLFLMGIAVWTPVGLIGYWFGRRARLYRYVMYLLRVVSPATRVALVDMLYEEAVKMTGEQSAGRPTASQL